jgi:hypothetical protein
MLLATTSLLCPRCNIHIAVLIQRAFYSPTKNGSIPPQPQIKTRSLNIFLKMTKYRLIMLEYCKATILVGQHEVWALG